jgi:hypothetical protein
MCRGPESPICSKSIPYLLHKISEIGLGELMISITGGAHSSRLKTSILKAFPRSTKDYFSLFQARRSKHVRTSSPWLGICLSNRRMLDSNPKMQTEATKSDGEIYLE